MAKKILIAVGIVVVFLVLAAGMYFWFFQGVYDKPAFGIKDYYDSHKQMITGQEQVMIGDVAGIQYITFQVNALNEDTTPLTVEIIDASPQELKDKLPIGIKKTVNEGDTGSWVSGLVDMSGFVNTDQTFSVTVKATSSVRKDAERSNELTITVEEDPEGQFSVDLTNGGNEDPGIIPEPETGVRFRTTDLSYKIGAVAYADACGQTLKKFGRTLGACTAYDCRNSGQTLMIPTSMGETKLWVQGTTEVCICEEGQVTGYPRRYATSDTDAALVSDSLISTGDGKELTC